MSLPSQAFCLVYVTAKDRDEAGILADRIVSLLLRLEEAIRTIHSYECLCIVALPLVGGSAPFLDWIAAQTLPR